MLLITAVICLLAQATATFQEAGYNPCGVGSVQNGQIFQPYPADQTKFIQCTSSGKAYLRACPPGYRWHLQATSCVATGQTPFLHGKWKSPGPAYKEGTGSQEVNLMNRFFRWNEQIKGNTASKSGTVFTYPQPQRPPSSTANQQNNRYIPSMPTNNQVGLPNSQNRPSARSENRGGTFYQIPAAPNVGQTLFKQTSGNYASTSNVNKNVVSQESNRPLKRPISNPCNHPMTRYVSHPSNPGKYYECVDGTAREKTCFAGGVFVQFYRKCVDLSEQTGRSQPHQNPCITGQVGTHSYQGDQTKYIECVTWYKMHVRSCPMGSLWNQQERKCTPIPTARPQVHSKGTYPVDTADPVRPPHTPTQPNAPNGVSSFCTNSKSYYHRYVPDPQKFIQCDEFGYMFIRWCGPEKTWDDTHKTCVGSNSDAIQITGGMAGAARESADSNLQYPCSDNEVYDSKQQICLRKNDPTNGLNDFVEVRCPPSYVWDEVLGQCDYSKESTEIDAPVCDQGFVWDFMVQMCMRQDNDDSVTHYSTSRETGSQSRRVSQYRPDDSTAMLQHYMGIGSSRTETGSQPAQTGYSTSGQPESEGANGAGYDYNKGQVRPIIDPAPPTDNPCEGDQGYYFPFPSDARFFIQCDQAHSMFIVPCATGTVWNQALLTCSEDSQSTDDKNPTQTDDINPQQPTLQVLHAGSDRGRTSNPKSQQSSQVLHQRPWQGGTAKENNEEGPADTPSYAGQNDVKSLYPCYDQSKTYHAYPDSPYLYIVCDSEIAHIMSCPYNTWWDPSINSCNHKGIYN